MTTREERYLESFLPGDFFRQIKAGGYKLDYYPPFSDRKAWKKARKLEAADRLIALADQVSPDVPAMIYSVYRQIRTKGYSDLDKAYFQRRDSIAYLALAICLTGDKERYMPRLMDYLVATLEEWTWCIPSHMDWYENGPAGIYPSDLYCCATGAMLAELVKILGAELEQEWRGITDWIGREALERTVYNVLETAPDAACHWWYNTNNICNWTVWCAFNCMLTAAQFEHDPVKLSTELRKFYRRASVFAASYGEDGYCDEGPHYYIRAGAMLFRAIDLMEKLRPGSAEKTYSVPKIRAILEFLPHTRIGWDFVVSYSDSQPRLNPWLSATIPAGIALKSELLLGLAEDHLPGFGLYGDLLTESLAVLFDSSTAARKGKSKQAPVTFFEGRIGILRSEQFSASLKGGCNGESHNHNDLGQFEIFFDGEPVIVDPGTGIYTRKNFSDERYTIWYIRGSGHNAPVIDGVEQQFGKDYTATLELSENRKVLRSDLSKAYPAEAGVKSFIRELNFAPEQVTVEDTVTGRQKTVTLSLMTHGKPRIGKNGTLRIGKVKLTLEGLSAVSVECMEDLCHGRSRTWKEHLYRLTLTGTEQHYKLLFTKG